MKRVVLVFGLLSGLISSGMMFLTLPFMKRGGVINFQNGAVIGFTAIFLSFLLVFFGIRSYRENNGGTITFGRAFAVGILITLISCVFYVVSWEIIYYNFMPDFLDRYSEATMASLQEKGATAEQIAAKKGEMEMMRKLYANPLTIAAVTLIEPFPIGLVMTLVSAGILRRREKGVGAGAAATIAA